MKALAQRMKEIAQEKDLHFLKDSIRRYQAKYGRVPSKLEDLMLRGVMSTTATGPLGWAVPD